MELKLPLQKGYYNGAMIFDASGQYLGEVESIEFADHIIRAVNAEESVQICKDLAEWDKRNPKGRIYPIGPNDVEKQLDAIVQRAKNSSEKALEAS